jgi:hypothetical protein
MSVATRKLMFLAFALAVGLPLATGRDTRWLAPGLVLTLIGVVLLRGVVHFSRPRRRKAPDPGLAVVLETCHAGEAMAARAWLRLNAIHVETVRVADRESAGSPPTGLRRIMVPCEELADAMACLSAHGVEPAGGAHAPGSPSYRTTLRLVHSASALGSRRDKRDND